MSTEKVVSYKIQAWDESDKTWNTCILDRPLRNAEEAKPWVDAYRRDGLKVRVVRKETVVTTTVTVVEDDPWAGSPKGERYEERIGEHTVRYVVGTQVWVNSPFTGKRWHLMEDDMRTYIERQSYVEH